ncbi:NAD(P)H nitroreductase [Actinomadura viridis]|uniref:Nitroreductase n=1 Tax=Actinomadura viridis TaxID=58110 RepID=A0A931GNB3_9ACTN|nr:hypothetical protein [Actinomadura viridis]MBG6093587.1 nitroreductase [Actinomadura viridis]
MGSMWPRSTVTDRRAEDARRAVEAAVWAPSVHNTQPWRFGLRGTRIGLRADPDRRLEVADPEGREMLISCGAALFTLRVAIRALGHEAEVHVLPDPDRPHLLADVHVGARIEEDEDARRLYAVVRRRRTHRGAFRPDPVRPSLLSAMKLEAEREGVRLIQVVETHTQLALAGLTQAAEHIQQMSPAYAGEAARWAPAPGSRRADGVHEVSYPSRPPHTEPDFAARDFARGHGWGAREEPGHEPGNEPGGEGGGGQAAGAPRPVTGLVILVATPDDTPLDWLRAGQALQRALLRATAEADLAAAFHTQPLEIPEFREFIGRRFCNGHHPQMLMRLGVPDGPVLTTVRRPAEEVVYEET